MFKTNLKLIFRNIWKYKGFSAINILGLSVGMACSIMILLWVNYHASFDKFHKNGDNIFRVIQHMKFEDYVTWAITQGPLGPSLKEEVPEIKDYCRLNQSGLEFKKGDEVFRERGTYADPSFFDMFTIKVIKKLKNAPISEPNNIAISKNFAKKYFGDEDPIGKTISALPDREFLITAVFENYPEETHWWFDYMIPFEHLGNLGYTIDKWNNSGYFTYVSLEDGITRENAEEKIKNFLDTKPTIEEFTKLGLQPIKKIHLTSGYDFDIQTNINGRYVKIFLIIGIFLILIACVNFMNLATARSSRRMREIGMKKVSGALRINLINHFIGEAILIALISVFFAMMFVELIRPTFNNITQIKLSIDYSDYRIYLGLIGLVLFTGLISGSYPAFYLSSFNPVQVLKGSFAGGKQNLRKILVIFQFTISIILITATLITTRQINYMLNKDLGYDKEGIIYFRISTQEFKDHIESIKDDMLKEPGVINMTLAGSFPTYGYNFSNSRFRWEGQDLSKEILFRATFVDYDYFSTFKMKFKEGREFSKDFASDSSAVILNEAAVKAMGFDNAIGKQIWTIDNPKKYHVVGIVKNFHYRSLHTDIEPQILILRPEYCYGCILKINTKEFESISKKLEEHWNTYDTESPIQINFLDESLDNLYSQDKVIRKILIFFTSIGIFISVLGLIGMTSFFIEQRNKEIAIRKVLGAKFKDILYILSSDFIKWIFISFIIATPITFYFLKKYLDNFAYRIILHWWLFLTGGIFVLVFALITISLQTTKAARMNPADSLRCE